MPPNLARRAPQPLGQKTTHSATPISKIRCPRQLSKNKCNENPVFPAINSCVNNMRDFVDERTVLQDDHCNEAKNNEPAKDNLRSSRQKKPSDKNDDFLWY